jgi:hypothetical protein
MGNAPSRPHSCERECLETLKFPPRWAKTTPDDQSRPPAAAGNSGGLEMSKKSTVLALTISLAATLSLAATASASWKHHQTAIQENVQIGLTGQARFQGALGAIECQVTARTTFQPGTTGLVETFVAHPTSDTTNCKGSGGLAFCQFHDLTAQGLPWTLHASGETTISVTSGGITSQATGGFCPVKHVLVAAGTITATLNQANTISSGQLSGTLTTQLETTSGVKDSESVTTQGTLSIESPNAATYSTGNPVFYIEGEAEEPIGGEAEAIEAEMQEAAPDGWKLTMSNGEALGPCSFQSAVQVWNDKTGGHASIANTKFTVPCGTSINECQVTAASAQNQPWQSSLFYDLNNNNTPTEFVGTAGNPIKFSYTLNGNGCGGLKGVTVTATAQGSVPAAHTGKGCYQFNKAGTFALSIGGGVTGTLDAVYCRTVAGKPVPAK